MSGFPAFEGFHDPDGGSEPWRFRIKLDTGRSLASAVIDIVDATSSQLIASDLVITEITRAAITDQPASLGNLWGVSFRATGGSATPVDTGKQFKSYTLRCRWTDDASPTPNGDDSTMILRVKQK